MRSPDAPKMTMAQGGVGVPAVSPNFFSFSDAAMISFKSFKFKAKGLVSGFTFKV